MNNNTIQLIMNMCDDLEEAESILTEEINNVTTKAEREEILARAKSQFEGIARDIRLYPSKIKKIRERGTRMNANQKFDELKLKLEQINNIWERENTATEVFQDITEEEEQQINDSKGRGTMFNPNAQLTIQAQREYDETSELGQKGVNMAKDTLRTVREANEQLNNITTMVKIQRIKLLQMQDKMKKSQSIVDQSSRILMSFSKELYSDKIIFGLLAMIALILIMIMVSAINYKLKSKAIIGKEIDLENNSIDIDEIDENLFYRTEIIEVNLDEFEQEEDIPPKEPSLIQNGLSPALKKKMATSMIKLKMKKFFEQYMEKERSKQKMEFTEDDSQFGVQNYSEENSSQLSLNNN